MVSTLIPITVSRFIPRHRSRWGAIVLSLSVGLGLVLPLATGRVVLAQGTPAPLWEQRGTLAPVGNEYPLDLVAGQVVTIRMVSEELDPMITLLGPSGEFLAFNDDAEGTLNSRIVFRATVSGRYTVQTQAFGNGRGRYDLRVTLATPYEVLIYDADLAETDGNYQEAMRALSSAIRLEPNQPLPYARRGFLRIRTFYETTGPLNPENLPPIPPTILRPALADLRTAANLSEAQGDLFSANYWRAEATFFETGEYPDPETLPLP